MGVISVESFLGDCHHDLPHKLWKLLRDYEFQKFARSRTPRKVVPLLDTYFRSPRKWLDSVRLSLFRLLWGFLSSRVGFKLLFCASAALNLSAFVVIMATNDETIYLIFYTLNSISLGGLMVIIPNVSLLVFGKRIGESIYSYYWMTFSLSNFFQFFITLILTNNPTTSDDYGEVLFFFSLCVISSIVLVIREKLQGPWKNSLDLVEFKRSSRKYNS